MASQKMHTINAKMIALNEEIQVITCDAEAQGRTLTESEQLDLKKLGAQFDSLVAMFDAAERNDKLDSPAGPVPNIPFARGGSSRGTGGFRSLGGFLGAIKAASAGQIDPRLIQGAVSTYGNESVGPDGGFSVPPEWRNSIVELVLGKGTLIDYMNPIITPSNLVTIPTDEAPAHGTSGISAAWVGEGATITASKPVLKLVNITINKVAGLVHATDELLEDNPNMDSYLTRVLARKIRFVVEDAIVAGDGVGGKPKGLLNGPATITQAKSATGSSAIAPRDLGNMVSRLVEGGFDNAFWLCHSSVLPELWSLVLGTTPLLVADYSKSPVGTLLGKPVVLSEACKDYNTPGDIMLVAPEGYGLALKSSGLKQDTTIAFGFDAGLKSFRATMRLGGTPLLSAAVARKNGSSTLGHVIALAARS